MYNSMISVESIRLIDLQGFVAKLHRKRHEGNEFNRGTKISVYFLRDSELIKFGHPLANWLLYLGSNPV